MASFRMIRRYLACSPDELRRFLLRQVRGESVACRFCVGQDGFCHLFWDCPFHVRERDKGLLKGFLSGVYGMDFYSDRFEGKAFPAVFVVDKMVLVTCFWDCPYPTLVSLRELPASFISRYMTHWPRCLSWHGWLPSLSGNMIDSP